MVGRPHVAAARLGDGPAAWHLATSTETAHRGMVMRSVLLEQEFNTTPHHSAMHISTLLTNVTYSYYLPLRAIPFPERSERSAPERLPATF